MSDKQTARYIGYAIGGIIGGIIVETFIGEVTSAWFLFTMAMCIVVDIFVTWHEGK